MQKQQQVEADRSTLAVSDMKQKPVLLRWYRWRQRVGLPYLFLAPFLLLFLLFFILPLGYALGISLFADRLVGGTVFVGSQNYLQALQDSSFWEGIRRMLLFMVVQVPVMLCLALIFALILDSGVAKLRTLFRLGFFLPYAIPSVVSALLWGYLYSPSFGPFAQIASSLHLPAPGFVTVLLFSFVATWNNYFLPLLVLSDPTYYPLTLGLASWNAQASANGGAQLLFTLVLTGSLISILPLIVAFLFLQRYWQGGLTLGSIRS